MNRFLTISYAGLVALSMTACFHSDEHVDDVETIEITLSKDEVLGTSTSTATATASISVDEHMMMSGTVMITGATDVQSVEIRNAYAGADDSSDTAVATLTTGSMAGQWVVPTGHSLSHEMHMAFGQGSLYVSVKDSSGEILRGQLLSEHVHMNQVNLMAMTSVTTSGGGFIAITAHAHDKTLSGYVHITGIAAADITSVEVVDANNSNANVVSLTATTDPLVFGISGRETLTDAEWTSIEAGKLQVLVKTTANASGELMAAIPQVMEMHSTTTTTDGHDHMH